MLLWILCWRAVLRATVTTRTTSSAASYGAVMGDLSHRVMPSILYICFGPPIRLLKASSLDRHRMSGSGVYSFFVCVYQTLQELSLSLSCGSRSPFGIGRCSLLARRGSPCSDETGRLERSSFWMYAHVGWPCRMPQKRPYALEECRAEHTQSPYGFSLARLWSCV